MIKEFDKWNEKKKKIHEKDFRSFVHEREIWWCSLGANIGHEEDGKNDKFERPILVIKKWSNKTIVIVPLTTKIKKISTTSYLNTTEWSLLLFCRR
jgi:mRNA interferase MazF